MNKVLFFGHCQRETALSIQHAPGSLAALSEVSCPWQFDFCPTHRRASQPRPSPGPVCRSDPCRQPPQLTLLQLRTCFAFQCPELTWRPAPHIAGSACMQGMVSIGPCPPGVRALGRLRVLPSTGSFKIRRYVRFLVRVKGHFSLRLHMLL